MQLIDLIYTGWPFYGSRRMTEELISRGFEVNRKRTQRLMQKMRIRVIYPRPNLSKPNKAHRIYPYLLKGIAIEGVNHVWGTDITYIPVRKRLFIFA